MSDPLPPIPATWRSTSTLPPEFELEPPDEFEPEDEPSVDLWSAVGQDRPWVTASLLLSWCALFAAMGLARELGDVASDLRWGALPSGHDGCIAPWRWLAYTGIHGNIVHLVSNGFTMVILGPAVERIFTRAHLALLFASGAIAGAWGTLMWQGYAHPERSIVSIGASGAVFALGGALLAAAWRLRHRLAPSRARALAASILWLVVPGIAIGFSKPEIGSAAHVGGFAGGLAAGLVLGLDPRLGVRPPARATRILGVLAGVALAATYVASLVMGEWRGGR